MKLLLWPIAVLVACAILLTWAGTGREPRVLRGRLSPALLRMVVLLLVLVGDRYASAQTRPSEDGEPIGVTVNGRTLPPPADPAPLPADLPARFDESAATSWAMLHSGASANLLMQLRNLREPSRRQAALAVIQPFLDPRPGRQRIHLPPAFRALLAAESPKADAASREQARSLPQLIRAAEELAAGGLYSTALVAYLWHTAPATVPPEDAPALAELYARLESHARMAGAIRLAQAETGPVRHIPWMSKAARPEGDTPRIVLPVGFADAVTRVYPTTTAGPWETDAALNFKLSDPATLYRRGQKIQLQPGSYVRLRRLDVLTSTGARAEHRLLGTMQLSAVLSSRNAAGALDDAGRTKLAEWSNAAFQGDADALKLLEMTLPLAVGAIDKTLADTDSVLGGRGASLRMLCLLYDE